MQIRISYEFCTDGDYSLRNQEEFGCTYVGVENYEGEIEFKEDDVQTCKIKARTFLKKLLCDGLHISYTHCWLVKDFYDMISRLIILISQNNEGAYYEYLSGNYDGTYIKVEFV